MQNFSEALENLQSIYYSTLTLNISGFQSATLSGFLFVCNLKASKLGKRFLLQRCLLLLGLCSSRCRLRHGEGSLENDLPLKINFSKIKRKGKNNEDVRTRSCYTVQKAGSRTLFSMAKGWGRKRKQYSPCFWSKTHVCLFFFLREKKKKQALTLLNERLKAELVIKLQND